MTPETKYRLRFNKENFTQLENLVILHLYGVSDDNLLEQEHYLAEDRTTHILDAIRDTAKQIVGWDEYPSSNSLRRLIGMTIREELPMEIVEIIATFLQGFQDVGTTIASDYLTTIKTISCLSGHAEAVLDGVQCASELHGMQGRLVYELLTTAHYLLMAAEATLKHDKPYLQDKLGSAENYMTIAQSSARQYLAKSKAQNVVKA